MGILSKLLTPAYIKEMEGGKPVVVAIFEGLFADEQLKQAMKVAEMLDYEVQNISQSGGFIDIAKYTVIFRKKVRSNPIRSNSELNLPLMYRES